MAARLIDFEDSRVLLAFAFLGCWYWWGAGEAPPRALTQDELRARDVGAMADLLDTAYDCSAMVIAYAVLAGDIEPVDTTAHRLAMDWLDEVPYEDARPGDVVVYDRNEDGRVEHVAIYVGAGMEVSMSGGGPKTKGADPKARGVCRPVVGHLCIGRWKPERRKKQT